MASTITTVGTTLEGQAYEIALKLNELELAVPEENRPNNTTIAYDTEANTVTIGITLATTLTIVDGKAQIAANAYLV